MTGTGQLLHLQSDGSLQNVAMQMPALSSKQVSAKNYNSSGNAGDPYTGDPCWGSLTVLMHKFNHAGRKHERNKK